MMPDGTSVTRRKIESRCEAKPFGPGWCLSTPVRTVWRMSPPPSEVARQRVITTSVTAAGRPTGAVRGACNIDAALVRVERGRGSATCPTFHAVTSAMDTPVIPSRALENGLPAIIASRRLRFLLLLRSLLRSFFNSFPVRGDTVSPLIAWSQIRDKS